MLYSAAIVLLCTPKQSDTYMTLQRPTVLDNPNVSSRKGGREELGNTVDNADSHGQCIMQREHGPRQVGSEQD